MPNTQAHIDESIIKDGKRFKKLVNLIGFFDVQQATEDSN